MDVEIRYEGNDITNKVINYNREQRICDGTGTFEFSMEGKTPFYPKTYETIVLYEEGVKKGTYYISQVTVDKPSAVTHLTCQDASKKLVDYFITEEYYIDYASTARYWIEKFLTEAKVTYHFTTDSPGGILSNDTYLGLNSAYDTIVSLCQMSGWHFYFDKNNVCQIGKFTLSGGIDDTFDESVILDYHTIKHDKMLRNRAVVWGAGNAELDQWVFADIHVHTPYNYDDNDLRAVVLSNSNIKTVSNAYSLASLLLNEFAQINYEKTLVIAGAPDVKVGDVLFIKTRGWSGKGKVTTIQSEMSATGLTTTVTLDERCPRLFGFFEYSGYVYIGTNGSGVWRKPFETTDWSDYSAGLGNLFITDLFVKNGVFACITADGSYYYKTEADSAWTLFTPPSLEDQYGNVYTCSGIKAVACSINDDNNIQVGYTTISGIVASGVTVSGVTVSGATEIGRSWVVETSPFGALIGVSKVIDDQDRDYTVVDLESTGSYNILTTYSYATAGDLGKLTTQIKNTTGDYITHLENFFMDGETKVHGPGMGWTVSNLYYTCTYPNFTPMDNTLVIDEFQNMWWIGMGDYVEDRQVIGRYNFLTNEKEFWEFSGLELDEPAEDVIMKVDYQSGRVDIIAHVLIVDNMYYIPHYVYYLGNDYATLVHTISLDIGAYPTGYYCRDTVSPFIFGDYLYYAHSYFTPSPEFTKPGHASFTCYQYDFLTHTEGVIITSEIDTIDQMPPTAGYDCDNFEYWGWDTVGVDYYLDVTENALNFVEISYTDRARPGHYWLVCLPGIVFWHTEHGPSEIKVTGFASFGRDGQSGGGSAGGLGSLYRMYDSSTIVSHTDGAHIFTSNSMGNHLCARKDERALPLPIGGGPEDSEVGMIVPTMGLDHSAVVSLDNHPSDSFPLLFKNDFIQGRFAQDDGADYPNRIQLWKWSPGEWTLVADVDVRALYGEHVGIHSYGYPYYSAADQLDDTFYVRVSGPGFAAICGVRPGDFEEPSKIISGVSFVGPWMIAGSTYIDRVSSGYLIYPLAQPIEFTGKVLRQLPASGVAISGVAVSGVSDGSFAVIYEPIETSKVEINKFSPTMIYPYSGGLFRSLYTSFTNLPGEFNLSVDYTPFDVRVYDITTESGFSRHIAVVESGTVKTCLEDYSEPGELVAMSGIATASGTFSHIETTNYEAEGTRFFLSISGAGATDRFFQKDPISPSFLSHSVNLPPSDITIIRTDDQI